MTEVNDPPVAPLVLKFVQEVDKQQHDRFLNARQMAQLIEVEPKTLRSWRNWSQRPGEHAMQRVCAKLGIDYAGLQGEADATHLLNTRTPTIEHLIGCLKAAHETTDGRLLNLFFGYAAIHVLTLLEAEGFISKAEISSNAPEAAIFFTNADKAKCPGGCGAMHLHAKDGCCFYRVCYVEGEVTPWIPLTRESLRVALNSIMESGVKIKTVEALS